MKKFDVTSTSDVPASPSVELMPRAADESATTEPYREAVGSLMWLANTTRPDIADAVRSVARHCHDPGVSHWKAVRKILSYIAGTVDLGLVYKRGSSDVLTVYADSSYAPKATDRRSVSGGLVMFCGAAIAWLSRTQRIVSLSSTEAEYIAVSDVLRETIFLRGVFQFIRPVEEIKPTKVFEDNQGAIMLAENPLSSARSKHIDVRYHHIRTQCSDRVIEIVHVPSCEQHGDMLTKPLGVSVFEYHREVVMGLK